MAGYAGMILTKAGLQLQAQAQIGGELRITKIAIGDGVLSAGEAYENLTTLKNQVMMLGIQDMQVTGDGQSRIRALITNDNLNTGFFVREIGVFAKNGDTGNEILYSYTNASDKADYLPNKGINVVEEVLEIYIVVGNAQNVTCNINDRVTLATKQDVIEHKTASILDHPDNSVTDAKIGNRTITDTVTATTGAGTLTNLLSKLGNMIKQITGKSTWYTAPATTLEAANTHITVSSSAHAASAISSTATGDVAATNVQAAIAELASEKAAISASFTNRLTDPTNRDLNNFKGVDYYWHFDTGGGAVLSTPYGTLANATAQVGTVRNYGINTNRIAQHLDLYYGNVNPLGTWCRFYNGDNNTWSAWKRLATMDLVAPAGYGLGANASHLAVGFDLNNLRGNGFFMGYGLLNQPTGVYGWVSVISMQNSEGGDILRQMATDIQGTTHNRFSTDFGATWSAWKQLATTDITFINRGDPPADWNSAVLSGAYMVHPDHPIGQANTAIIALGMYPYGQLMVSTTENNQAIRQTYYTHRGDVAIRMFYSGGAWSPWRAIANADQTTYITASGTGTGYRWRKWSNGDIEIFGSVAAVIATSGSIVFPNSVFNQL
jgi:hypothetical protein